MTAGLRRALLVLAGLAVAVLGYVFGRGMVQAPPSAAEPAAPPASAAPAAAEPEAVPGDAALPDEAPAFDAGRAPRREWRQAEGGRRGRLRDALRGERQPAAGETLPLARAIAEHAADVWVEGEGEVRRTLRDDLRGRQHQRFVVGLAGGGTLLVAHNTRLGGRVPAEVGATVRFRGRYEWNRRGGIVHWTHRDPRGAFGGWLEVDGRRYE